MTESKIEELRGYGVPFSDLESSMPAPARAELEGRSKGIVMASLSPLEKLLFGVRFIMARGRLARVDLSHVRARGMDNEVFLTTQREFVALFSALARTVGMDRAQAIMERIMEATAPLVMRNTLPAAEEIRALGDDTLATFKRFFAPMPRVSAEAGAHDIEVVVDEADRFRFDITYCVWYELACAFGAPEACVSNCYFDEVGFPDYYRAIGLEFSRTGTLARGADRCDFCFARISED